jgi:speckle-type POZ protein
MKTEGEKNVLNYLGHIFNSGIDSDIEFIVKGEKIAGHKLILCGRSPVLSDLIKINIDKIYINDTEPKVFRLLLLYLYTGNVPYGGNDHVTELLFIAARKYKIELLEDLCSSILSSKLNKDCAIRLLILAHQYSAAILKEKCLDFIVKNSEYFWDREEFKKFGQTNYELFFEITKHKNFMNEKVRDSKANEFLSYDQVKEQTKFEIVNSSATSTTKHDQGSVKEEKSSDQSLKMFLENYRQLYDFDTKAETDSQDDASEYESNDSSDGSSSSGIDLRRSSSSVTSQLVNKNM